MSMPAGAARATTGATGSSEASSNTMTRSMSDPRHASDRTQRSTARGRSRVVMPIVSGRIVCGSSR